MKFKKHKKSVNHLQNDEVTALKEDMRAKKKAKEADEEEKKQLMDEEKVEVELTKQEKHEAKCLGGTKEERYDFTVHWFNGPRYRHGENPEVVQNWEVMLVSAT